MSAISSRNRILNHFVNLLLDGGRVGQSNSYSLSADKWFVDFDLLFVWHLLRPSSFSHGASVKLEQEIS